MSPHPVPAAESVDQPDNVRYLPEAVHDDGQKPKRQSTATKLVSLANTGWRVAPDAQGNPFAVPVEGPPIARPLTSRSNIIE